MKKWLLLTFIVTWSQPQQQPQIIACPNGQMMMDKKTGTEYIAACITTPSTPSKEFKTRKEAQAYKDALQLIVPETKPIITENK